MHISMVKKQGTIPTIAKLNTQFLVTVLIFSLLSIVFTVSIDPREVTVKERSQQSSTATISALGEGLFKSTVYVNLCALTYSQYEELGGDVDLEFPVRPPPAQGITQSFHSMYMYLLQLCFTCDVYMYGNSFPIESDLNTSVQSIGVSGTQDFDLNKLVLANDTIEHDEGFILYLKVDQERTKMDYIEVVVDNNATLVTGE